MRSTYKWNRKWNEKAWYCDASSSCKYDPFVPTARSDGQWLPKAFLKAKFTEWFSQKIEECLNEGKDLEDIDIPLTLPLLKTLHASWVVDLYNCLATTKGKVVIENGWKKAGITEAIEGGYSKLQPSDPFESTDPFMRKENPSILCTDCYIDANNLYEIQRTEEEEESNQENEW